MNITLKQRDIELALKMYLSAQGIILTNRSFNVEFTAGRKDSGLSASIDIGPAEALADVIIKAVESATPDVITSQHKSLLPTAVVEEDEQPEGELTQEAALATLVSFQEAASEIDSAQEGKIIEGGPVTMTPTPIFTPNAEVPIAAPANVASVSLFA